MANGSTFLRNDSRCLRVRYDKFVAQESKTIPRTTRRRREGHGRAVRHVRRAKLEPRVSDEPCATEFVDYKNWTTRAHEKVVFRMDCGQAMRVQLAPQMLQFMCYSKAAASS